MPVVFGIINSNFTALREKRERTEHDIQNRCFICGCTKEDIQARELKSFQEHVFASGSHSVRRPLRSFVFVYGHV
jgi:hypothetical protein